jgi:hypothetical protein
MRIKFLIPMVAAGLAVTACDVEQTEEGEMPEVNVEEGNMPEYEVDGPEIKAGTTETQVEVPDVDVTTEEETVEVPVVGVEPGDVDEGGQ